MSQKNDKQFQMRVSEEFLATIDDWRREHPDIPPRAEAIRELIALGLKANKYKNMARRLVKLIHETKLVGITKGAQLATFDEIRSYLAGDIDFSDDQSWEALEHSYGLTEPTITAEYKGKKYKPLVAEDGLIKLQFPEYGKHSPEFNFYTDNMYDVPAWVSRGASLYMNDEDGDAALIPFEQITIRWDVF